MIRQALHLPTANPQKHWLTPELLMAGILLRTHTAQQSQYLRHCHQEQKGLTGQRWAKTVICYLWTKLHQKWKTRCQRMHSKAIDLENTLLRSQAQTLLNLHESVSPYDHDLFPTDHTRFLELPNNRLKAWIRVTGPAIHNAVRLNHRRRNSGQTSISAFFRPPRKPPYSSQPDPQDPPTPTLANPPTNPQSAPAHRLPTQATLPDKCHA